MPLFVFVSGFFSHITTRERYLWHIWELLAYYLVFQAIHLGIGYFCYHTPVTLQSLLIPAFSLWYLLSLFFWKLMIGPFAALRRPMWAAVIVSVYAGLTSSSSFLSLTLSSYI